MILFNVIGDIFGRHDITGWGKVLWLIAIILLPYLGVFIYLIVEHEGLVQRSVKRRPVQRWAYATAASVTRSTSSQ
jgi:ABC-type Fe3+ transport system permease subunit